MARGRGQGLNKQTAATRDFIDELNEDLAKMSEMALDSPPWRTPDDASNVAALQIGRRNGIHPAVAQRVVNKGAKTYDEKFAWYRPGLDLLVSPEDTVQGMEAAAESLHDTMYNGKKIAIYGDYDPDGTMGVSALRDAFLHYVPEERLLVEYANAKKGFGLTNEYVRQANAWGADTLVTVDCGSGQAAAVALAQKLGMKVIVIDHHIVDHDNPADFHLNPLLYSEEGAETNTGSQLAWKLGLALHEAYGDVPDSYFGEPLYKAGFGCRADMGNVVDYEHRTFFHYAVDHMGDDAVPPSLFILAEEIGKRQAAIDLKKATDLVETGDLTPDHIAGIAKQYGEEVNLSPTSAKTVLASLTDEQIVDLVQPFVPVHEVEQEFSHQIIVQEDEITARTKAKIEDLNNQIDLAKTPGERKVLRETLDDNIIAVYDSAQEERKELNDRLRLEEEQAVTALINEYRDPKKARETIYDTMVNDTADYRLRNVFLATQEEGKKPVYATAARKMGKEVTSQLQSEEKHAWLTERVKENPADPGNVVRINACLNLPKRAPAVDAKDIAALLEARDEKTMRTLASKAADTYFEYQPKKDEMVALALEQIKKSKKGGFSRSAVLNDHADAAGYSGTVAQKVSKETGKPAIIFAYRGTDEHGQEVYKFSIRNEINSQKKHMVGELIDDVFMQEACELLVTNEFDETVRKPSIGGHPEVVSGSCTKENISSVRKVFEEWAADKAGKSGKGWELKKSDFEAYPEERWVEANELGMIEHEAKRLGPYSSRPKDRNFALNVSMFGKVKPVYEGSDGFYSEIEFDNDTVRNIKIAPNKLADLQLGLTEYIIPMRNDKYPVYWIGKWFKGKNTSKYALRQLENRPDEF